MAIDTSQPRSPGWWFDRLAKKLEEQASRAGALNAYYANEVAVRPNSNKAVRQAYARLMSMARTNFAELIVEAVRERMNPTGFRTGVDGDELGDREAWRIWQANQLDADCQQLLRAQLSMATAYTMVGPPDDETGAPTITIEDPREVVTEQHPSRKRRTVAALKLFRDDVVGVDMAYVYLPGVVFRAARKTGESVPRATIGGFDWVDSGQALPPLLRDVVPVVQFANRPSGGAGVAEFEPHLPILDRINYTILQRLEVATLQAFRQRAIKGDFPLHDSDGMPVDYDDIFAADPGALWQLPATAEIWESGVVDLTGIRESLKDDVRDLSAVSRTPMYLFTPDAASGSAEGAALLRESLVFKTQDRIKETSESLEQTMSLAFLWAGDPARAARTDMEVLWEDPNRPSLAERSDAATKQVAAGVPWRTVMRDVIGASPQAIERMQAERDLEMLRQAASAAALAAPVTNA